jgi:arsenate-mycothiol transferase
MAAALMRAKSGDEVNVLSGGTHPGDVLSEPARIAALELGATMDGEYPKEITDEVFMNVDRIVILGNEAKLTAVDGMRGTIETWLTPEPGPEVGDKLEQTRVVRDDIASRVENLYNQLTKN